MVAFLKVVGPKLKTAGVKLLAPEASEWVHFWSNDSACCSVGGKQSSDPLKCGFPGTKCAAVAPSPPRSPARPSRRSSGHPDERPLALFVTIVAASPQ